LYFLPAIGPAPTTLAAAEILSSTAAGHALHRLKSQFDLVVIDAPPLLPVIDARILADHADQIVFVMAWRRTPKQLARRALNSLGFNQSKLVGVVVNQVDPEVLAEQTSVLTDLRRAIPWPAQGPPGRRAA
jgi:Mrp family chromosome partitioning ATPase